MRAITEDMHYYNFIWVAMSESDRCTLRFYALDKREWKLLLKFDFWFISLFDFTDHNTETKNVSSDSDHKWPIDRAQSIQNKNKDMDK